MEIENRLKTLEEKIEFIMEKVLLVKDMDFGMATLKDLWDEENEVKPMYVEKSKVISDKILGVSGAFNQRKRKEYIENNEQPSVKCKVDCKEQESKYCPCDFYKPSVKGDRCFHCDKVYVDDGGFCKDCQMPKTILYGKPSVKVYEQCAETLDKADKKKEILDEFELHWARIVSLDSINGGIGYPDYKFLKSWLSDKLDVLSSNK